MFGEKPTSAECIIAANSNYFELRFNPANNKPTNTSQVREHTIFSPVIAWKISPSGEPITLTPAGDGDTIAILCPNGNVITPDGQHHAGFDAWATTTIYPVWRSEWLKQKQLAA